MPRILNKRWFYLSILLLGVLVVTAQFFTHTPVAEAQSTSVCTVLTNGELNRSTCSSNQIIQYDNCLASNARDTVFCRQSLGLQAVTDSTGNVVNQPTNTRFDEAAANNVNKCTFNPSNWDLCFSYVVYIFTVGIGSTFAFIGAYFFDIVVSLALNSLAYAQSFISQGWTMARDLANMGFILALVYIAYTILLKAESGGTMRMLAWVIVMALIINFSFFFTRLVIDAGNILAVQFYNAIPTKQTLADTLGDTRGGSAVNSGVQFLTNNNNTFARTKDLTHPIMNGLNMQGLFDTPQFNAWYQTNKGGGGWVNVLLTLSFIYIAVGAMYFILAVMFLAAGIKFLVRIVVLWFLIMASPLAFLAKTTSLSQKYYDLWQKNLITHTFYPVIFLFIFLFISLVMDSLNPGNTSGGLTNSIIGDLTSLNTQNAGSAISIIAASIANVAIRLGFVVAMLYIGMRAADKIGVIGATAASTFTNWVSRRGTGALFGGSAWAMRSSLGWAANSAYNSRGLKKFASENRIVGGALWRGAGALSRRSFDVRNIETARKGLGKLGVDTTQGAAGGYASSYSDRIKKRLDEANKLKPTAGQIQRAQEEALEKMTPEDKIRLQAAEENYTRNQARFDAGEINEQELKRSKKLFDDQLKPLLDSAKKLAGSGNPSNYATSIDTKQLQNLGGATGHFPVPGWISAADKEAAAQLRAPKEEADRLRNLIKNLTTPSVIGPGGSAFDTSTATERINAEPDPLRREKLQEAQQAMQGWITNAPSYVSKPKESTFTEPQKVELGEKSLDTLRGLQSGLKEVVKGQQKAFQHIASAPQQSIPQAQKTPEQETPPVEARSENDKPAV